MVACREKMRRNDGTLQVVTPVSMITLMEPAASNAILHLLAVCQMCKYDGRTPNIFTHNKKQKDAYGS